MTSSRKLWQQLDPIPNGEATRFVCCLDLVNNSLYAIREGKGLWKYSCTTTDDKWTKYDTVNEMPFDFALSRNDAVTINTQQNVLYLCNFVGTMAILGMTDKKWTINETRKIQKW